MQADDTFTGKSCAQSGNTLKTSDASLFFVKNQIAQRRL
jgi:hypothetical protein